MPASPKALLLDLDGTLADTALDFYVAVNQLRAQQNKPALEKSKIREQVSNGGYALAALAYDTDQNDANLSEYREQLLSIYGTLIGQTSNVFDGFESVLNALKNHDITWGIVTNKPRYLTELFLQRINLDAPVLICPDDVKHAKPAPDALLLAAQKLKLTPEQCWYVGDHIRDIQASRAANMYSIAATFGYLKDKSEAQTWHANALIDHPLDLLELLSINNED